MKSEELATNIRIKCLEMVHHGKSSHIGCALSCVDILTVLYSSVMHFQPELPSWEERDRFILSKGHAGAAVYATLAEFGFFSKELLNLHYQNGSQLSGHVSHKNVPGVELSTGSLGHGLPVAVGMALAAKADVRDAKVFVLMGDGEIAEGTTWESLLFAAHHRLDNLTIIIDRNGLQSFCSTEDTVALESIPDKFSSFNVDVVSIDGHNHIELQRELSKSDSESPKVVIANTVKGKGVSFMEGSVQWHYKFPDADQLRDAISELRGKL